MLRLQQDRTTLSAFSKVLDGPPSLSISSVLSIHHPTHGDLYSRPGKGHVEHVPRACSNSGRTSQQEPSLRSSPQGQLRTQSCLGPSTPSLSCLSRNLPPPPPPSAFGEDVTLPGSPPSSVDCSAKEPAASGVGLPSPAQSSSSPLQDPMRRPAEPSPKSFVRHLRRGSQDIPPLAPKPSPQEKTSSSPSPSLPARRAVSAADVQARISSPSSSPADTGVSGGGMHIKEQQLKKWQEAMEVRRGQGSTRSTPRTGSPVQKRAPFGKDAASCSQGNLLQSRGTCQVTESIERHESMLSIDSSSASNTARTQQSPDILSIAMSGSPPVSFDNSFISGNASGAVSPPRTGPLRQRRRSLGSRQSSADSTGQCPLQ